MKPKPRVVFDTNIYISAILFGGNPRICLELAREGEIQLVTSRAILLELTTNLREKFNWREEDIAEVIEGIGKFAKVVEPVKRINLIKAAPEDNRILECADEGKADYLISGDKKHILPLKSFKGKKIVTAKQFLDKFFAN